MHLITAVNGLFCPAVALKGKARSTERRHALLNEPASGPRAKGPREKNLSLPHFAEEKGASLWHFLIKGIFRHD